MEKAAQPGSSQAKDVRATCNASRSPDARARLASHPSTDRLAQTAALINGSPVVQAQRQMMEWMNLPAPAEDGYAQNAPVQRVAINLQPDDDVSKAAVKYANEQLGINEVPLDSVAAANGHVLGQAENIYLFGHGGSSDVDVEEHDLFARTDMPTLATQLHANITFPHGYTGTIYLIGCKTDSLLSTLKSQLDAKTGQNINIRGTTEILQTGQGGAIRLRGQAETIAEVDRREGTDMQRRFYEPLKGIRTLIRNAVTALKDANDPATTKRALLDALRPERTIDSGLNAIRGALEKLKGKSSPKMRGRESGFREIEKIYVDLQKAQETFIPLLTELRDLLLEQESGQEVSAKIRVGKAKLLKLLREDYTALNDEIRGMGILINIYDAPDMLQTTAFSLDQMVDVTEARGIKNLKDSRLGLDVVVQQIQGWTQTALKRTLLWKEINMELTDPQQDWRDNEVAIVMNGKIKKLSTYLAVLHRIQVAQSSPDQLYESANQATRRKLDLDPNFRKKRSTFNSLLEHEKPESLISAALELSDQMHDIARRLTVEAATETSTEISSMWGSGGFGFF